MNKKIVSFVAVASMTLSTLAMTMPAYAADSTNTTNHDNFLSGLVSFLADKFHLDSNQVKAAIDEYHEKNKPTQAQMEQEMETREKTRLDKLVSDGKITSDQESAIIAELKAVRAKYNPESMKDLSQDQRKQKMDAMRAELQTWVKEKGIDEKYVMLMGGPRGFDRHGRMGSSVSSTPAQ